MKRVLEACTLALGLAGCGSEAKPSAVQVDAAIEKSLERLQTLAVFSADRLVLKLPAEATACYGLPCDKDKWQQPIADERARQAPRLSKLADLTEAATHDATLTPRPSYDAEAAVQALASLEIVEVWSLVQVQPKNNPECYNLPCAADQAEAERQDGLHIAQAFAIAEAAKKAGL